MCLRQRGACALCANRKVKSRNSIYDLSLNSVCLSEFGCDGTFCQLADDCNRIDGAAAERRPAGTAPNVLACGCPGYALGAAIAIVGAKTCVTPANLHQNKMNRRDCKEVPRCTSLRFSAFSAVLCVWCRRRPTLRSGVRRCRSARHRRSGSFRQPHRGSRR